MTEHDPNLAVADFIDWLADCGYVIAKRDDVHLWTPINEDEGEMLAQIWLKRNV